MNKRYGWLGLTLLVVLWMAGGCMHDAEFKTQVVIKAYEIDDSKQKTPLSDVVLYGYGVDTATYRPASYEDALAGVLTNRFNPEEQVEAERTGTLCHIDNFGPTQMVDASGLGSLYVLVVDRTNRLYAITQLALVENLPHLYLSVVFDTTKSESFYKSGNWLMYNDFYMPNIKLEIEPRLQITPDGSLSAVKDSHLFVYRDIDPEAWYVASYEEAQVGRLRSVENNTPRDFDISTSANTAGKLTVEIKSEEYLLLLFNNTYRSYALRPFGPADMVRAKAKNYPPTSPSGDAAPLPEGLQGPEMPATDFDRSAWLEEIGRYQNQILGITFASWQMSSPYEDEQGWLIYTSPQPEEENPEEEPEEENPGEENEEENR